MTLDDFRAAFSRVAVLTDEGFLPVARCRGDHDLNPGMLVPDAPRAAAVLVPIVEREDGLTILLTRRSDSLPVHRGQISFPGGRVEDDDVDGLKLSDSKGSLLTSGSCTFAGRKDSCSPVLTSTT